MTDIITELNVAAHEIDTPQRINEKSMWVPLLDDDVNPDQAVFVASYIPDESPGKEEAEYVEREGGYLEEPFWVYKTDWTVGELLNADINPEELINQVKEEYPEVDIVGLCAYAPDRPLDR